MRRRDEGESGEAILLDLGEGMLELNPVPPPPSNVRSWSDYVERTFPVGSPVAFQPQPVGSPFPDYELLGFPGSFDHGGTLLESQTIKQQHRGRIPDELSDEMAFVFIKPGTRAEVVQHVVGRRPYGTTAGRPGGVLAPPEVIGIVVRIYPPYLGTSPAALVELFDDWIDAGFDNDIRVELGVAEILRDGKARTVHDMVIAPLTDTWGSGPSPIPQYRPNPNPDLALLLRQVGEELAPMASRVRLGKTDALKDQTRTFQTGLCWSFAEGVRLWLKGSGMKGDIVSVWVEDPDFEQYPIHVLCRAPSGILLDSLGAWQPEDVARYQAEQFLEDDADVFWVDYTEPISEDEHGIYAVQPELAAAVAARLEEHGDASSYDYDYPKGRLFDYANMRAGRGEVLIKGTWVRPPQRPNPKILGALAAAGNPGQVSRRSRGPVPPAASSTRVFEVSSDEPWGISVKIRVEDFDEDPGGGTEWLSNEILGAFGVGLGDNYDLDQVADLEVAQTYRSGKIVVERIA